MHDVMFKIRYSVLGSHGISIPNRNDAMFRFDATAAGSCYHSMETNKKKNIAMAKAYGSIRERLPVVEESGTIIHDEIGESQRNRYDRWASHHLIILWMAVGFWSLVVVANNSFARPNTTAVQALVEEPITNGSILVVYLDDDDPAQLLMAQHVADGAKSVQGVDVTMIGLSEASFVDHVLPSDGIILGSSVENANVHPKLQEWINNEWTLHYDDYSSKVGAAFVTAGGISAGQERTLTNLLQTMMIFGMIVVGGEDWESSFGAAAITYEYPQSDTTIVHPIFLEKARSVGHRAASLVQSIRLAKTCKAYYSG